MTPLLALAFTYHLAQSSQIQVARFPSDFQIHSSAAAMSSMPASSAAVSSPVPASSVPASSVAMSSASSSLPAVRSDNKIGVYLTGSSVARKGYLDQIIDSLVSAHASSFVLDVKGSYVYFDSSAPMATEKGLMKPMYDIREVIAKAHAKGLYVIGRFISLKDVLFSQKTPDAQIHNPKTGVSVGALWVDGSAPATLQYNSEIMRDLVMTGIDEVNMDYIRFPTEYSKAAVGVDREGKTSRVEAFIKMMRQTIDQYNPRVKLGMSTYAIIGWNYDVNVDALGQDVVRFAPLVDVISPMAYPNSFAKNEYFRPGKDPRSRMYYLVYRTLTGYAKSLGLEQAQKLRPWIQGYYATPHDIRDEIDAVYDSGHCGFQVWNANNNYGPAFAAIKGLPTPPERCR